MELRQPPTGRLGFITSGGRNQIGNIKAWHADPSTSR